ncbi:MAG: dihydroorotase [Candidatus Tyrphobacter sp.]
MLVRGGRLVDPASGIDALRDLRLSDRVLEIGEHLENHTQEEVVDAAGCTVAPGFIDMHVHLREPGNPEKETIASGTEAAVRGGFTAVACMPNTNPAIDDAAAVAALLDACARKARCRVYPIAALTLARAGRVPCDFLALARAGAVAFSDDGAWVESEAVVLRAIDGARALATPFISHCEPEVQAIERDAELARRSGRPWHIAHLSTREGLEMLQKARARGARVTAEVTPHHLSLCDSDAVLRPSAQSNPPLRTADDVRAMRDAVRSGAIDVLASDHAPHTAADKTAGAPGFTGLEVAVGAYAAALPDLPLPRFVELLSANPARVLGVEGGTLKQGSRADLTIFREEWWRVDARTFASRGKTTPFDGVAFGRRAIATIVGGRVAYHA